MMYKATLAHQYDADLGEGPIWDQRRQELIWLDVTRGKVLFFSPTKQSQSEVTFNKHIGALALSESSDLIFAMRDGFARYSTNLKKLISFVGVLDSPDVRFNDGAVDRQGRFVAGTMGYQPSPKTGRLFSFTESAGFRTLIPEVGVSNGICWNKNSTLMYYVDSLQRSIQLFDYNLISGDISNPRVLVEFEESLGIPDGMTIDQEGNLWVAMWAGAKVLKVNPKGEITNSIDLPVSKVTSVTFGGERLQDLFITTARYEMTSQELELQPLSGSLFRVETDTCGFAENRMK